MGRIIFVTGTDTAVGKTLVSALVIANLKNRGLTVAVCKPAETGCELTVESGELIPSDGALLNLLNDSKQELSDVVPYRFKAAVAPFVAAQLERKVIDVADLKQHIAGLSESVDVLIVEGAGGLLVPLAADYTFADLVADCEMHVLVVVGSKLGALNHAALTFEVARSRGLALVGYVFNDLYNIPGEADEALLTNSEALAQIAAGYEVAECCYLARSEEVLDVPAIVELASSPQVMGLCDQLVKPQSV